MIVVYPMICSGTIAESTLPAIAKTLERYLIVYYMSEIVRDENRATQVGARNFKINKESGLYEYDVPIGAGTGNKNAEERERERRTLDPQFDITSDRRREERDEEKGQLERDKAERDRQKHGMEIDKQRRDVEKHGMEMDKPKREAEKEKRGPIKMDVSQPSVDISPTYVTISSPSGPSFVGVKVVAIRVKSELDFTYYLEKDQDLNFILSMAVSMGRGTLRKIYSVYDRFIGSKLGHNVPTGDARHDVIYARTGFSIKGLTLVDRNAMSEDFMRSARQVNRMHSLGWNNIILADDINRYAYFCMQKFRGVCNSIPYQMMYRTLGQEQVYDSIEQTRMKNSSLFKTGPKFSKLLGESVATKKRDRYVWSEDQSFLAENDLTGLTDKLTQSKFKTIFPDLKEKVETNDYRGAYNMLHILGINETHLDSAFEKGKENDSELEESVELARKLMKNSLPAVTMKNKNLVDVVTKGIAFTASLIKKKHGNSTKKATKYILEEYIPKVRSFYEEQKQEESQPSKRPKAAIYHTIEAAIGIIWMITVPGAIAGLYFVVVTHIWIFLGLLAVAYSLITVLRNLKPGDLTK